MEKTNNEKKKKSKTTARLKTLILTDTADKAKTLRKLLGRQYQVISSDGFLRDLPKTQIGIDPENDFEPKYITVRGKGKLLEQIRKESLNARRIFALTDESDEGEAIAYHYSELFGINPSSKFRITIKEMTKKFLKSAFDNSRSINMSMINSFEASRAVQRLFIFNLNPILWHKIYRGISINLNQSLILRLICEQEKKLQNLPPRITIDELKEKWNSPLTWKTLQLFAAYELNLHTGLTSLISKQLYEGVNINKTCTGLITYHKHGEILISSENHSPEELKEYLTPAQLNLYTLIWKHFNKEEIDFSKSLKSLNRYDDFMLMLELEDKGIAWEQSFSISVCGMMKRKYIELTDNGYKPTELGLNIAQVLKDYFSTITASKSLIKVENQIKSVAEGDTDKLEVMEIFYKQLSNAVNKAVEKIGEDLTPKEEPSIETDEICDKCGRKMVIRRSRYGMFLACSGYPECKNSKPYFEKLEETCPKCGGHLLRRKWNKGRKFYSCENYQTCDFSTWDEPQNRTCNTCGSTLFLHTFKDRAPMLYCGNEQCPTRKEHPINLIIQKAKKNAETKRQKKNQKK